MWLLLVFAIALLIYIVVRKKHEYWKKRNIPYTKPTFLFGHSLKYTLGKENYHSMLKRFYDSIPNVPYIGCFEGLNPILIVRDPAAVIDITIKNSSYFDGRYLPWFMRRNNNELNPLSQNIFSDEGSRWRIMRQQLTHIFSSSRGRKILTEIASNTAQEMESAIASSNEIVDLQDLCMRYLLDVIGYWIFGIKCNTLNREESEFVDETAKVFGNNITLKYLLYEISPKLLDWLRIPDFREQSAQFIVNLIRDNVRYRKENNISTGDYLDVLIKAVEENRTAVKKNYNEIDIFGNSFVAVAAGFESTASILSYALYELALNDEFQRKAREEIQTVLTQHGGKLDIDTLSDLKYVEMVLLESSRKYPVDPFINRQCTESYVLPGTTTRIDVGTVMVIPTYGFHLDPEHFPDPERFDPERFSPENKASIPKGAYVGFGEGQRICIGMKSALTIMKVAMVKILSQYKLSPCNKTPIPVNFKGGLFFLKPTEPIVVKVEKLH